MNTTIQQQAFGNSNETKALLEERAIEAYDKGWYVHDGTVWSKHGEEGKPAGCALGIILRGHGSERYSDFESVTNMPVWFAKVIEMLYEGMDDEAEAAKFTKNLLTAIPVGFSDWNGIWARIMPDITKGYESALDTYYDKRMDDIIQDYNDDENTCQGKHCGKEDCEFCEMVESLDEDTGSLKAWAEYMGGPYNPLEGLSGLNNLHVEFDYGRQLRGPEFPAEKIAKTLIRTLQTYHTNGA